MLYYSSLVPADMGRKTQLTALDRHTAPQVQVAVVPSVDRRERQTPRRVDSYFAVASPWPQDTLEPTTREYRPIGSRISSGALHHSATTIKKSMLMPRAAIRVGANLFGCGFNCNSASQRHVPLQLNFSQPAPSDDIMGRALLLTDSAFL